VAVAEVRAELRVDASASSLDRMARFDAANDDDDDEDAVFPLILVALEFA